MSKDNFATLKAAEKDVLSIYQWIDFVHPPQIARALTIKQYSLKHGVSPKLVFDTLFRVQNALDTAAEK